LDLSQQLRFPIRKPEYILDCDEHFRLRTSGISFRVMDILIRKLQEHRRKGG